MKSWIVKFDSRAEVVVQARTAASARNKAKRIYPHHGAIVGAEATA